jgi:GH15 family glucan-1,4-alpha-glucosidase
MSASGIADYALLSDRHSAALVSLGGSIDWLCFPRFDSPSIFARLLGEEAGFWLVRAADAQTITRRYLDRSLVLETTFVTATGTATIIDALAIGSGNRGHDLGKDAPHLLLRKVSCSQGEVEVDLQFVPRPEYGLVSSFVDAVDGGVAAIGGCDASMLTCPVPLSIDGSSASGRFVLRRGEEIGLALDLKRQVDRTRSRLWSQMEIAAGLDDTVAAWTSWSELHQLYVGPWHERVQHSGRVLQALSYQPTGAICAAATTSLPETLGGTRNWDYRYSWVRDASFTIDALWVAACPDEANQFFDYVHASAAGSLEHGHDLQIMFGIGGERDLTERELPHLPGWENSGPVRVGNAAWRQRQLDVYGELLDAAYRNADHLFPPKPDDAPAALHGRDAPPGRAESTRRFLVQLAEAAAQRWQEKDHGIWEVRSEPRHFVYSKLMCWVALARATAMADSLDASGRVPDWMHTQQQISDAILSEGWSDRVNAFTQSFGCEDLDASNLMLAMVGFLPPDDPKMLATIDATEERLTDDLGLVHRYRSQDGLEGTEGAFLLCTFWLAQALAMAGRLERARTVFERAAAFANDVGLLAEEVDPRTGQPLGNFPQAFSHIGLVNAAWAISEAGSRRP